MPIFKKLIQSGYADKIISVVISEKRNIGIATVQNKDTCKRLYWNAEKDNWQDENPNIDLSLV